MIDSHRPTYWFHRYPRATLFGIAFSASLLALTATELSVRIFFPGWAPTRAERAVFWRYNELLGWAQQPGQEGRFVHRDFSVTVKINSQGLRDEEYSLERTEKKRMLVLGDSFGWGFGVEQHERFTELLEAKHRDWEIINAAVSGYGTGQQFLYLKNRGMHYLPDVVLLLFFRNDFGDNVCSEGYWYFKPSFNLIDEHLCLRNVPVPQATLGQKLNRFFYGRTYFVAKLYYFAYALRLLLESPPSKGNHEINPVPLNKQDKKYSVTRHLLAAINTLCQQNSARFILVSIPMPAAEKTILSDLSAKENIPYLPLDPYFLNFERQATFPHDEHWNACGHQIAAHALEQFLKDIDVFGARLNSTEAQ
ncbi:SGNH/GDSL hydrolase family protein [candidate division KSB1 bacterium]|nr:SGNH/GDSL hydrolase family protein [candidate division KSB1 bacterium]